MVIKFLGYSVFTPRAYEVGKFNHFAEKIVFRSTLETPREKTVHLRELVMLFKVVVNNIVEIIPFDHNTATHTENCNILARLVSV